MHYKKLEMRSNGICIYVLFFFNKLLVNEINETTYSYKGILEIYYLNNLIKIIDLFA